MTTSRFEQARAALSTLRDLVRFAVSRFGAERLFFGHGSATAWDEAVYLVLHTLHLPPDQLEPFLDARLTPVEIDTVLEIIERRCQHVPAAYLTHEAWLGPLSFYVDERVIVPRSFIAELLFDGLAPWIADSTRVTRVLDLCTGSGCLAIIAAQQFPGARVDALDISATALEVAAINRERYQCQSVELVESDLFAALEGQRYDLIVCNPPYVPDASMGTLPEEYRREPEIALRGGSDGLDLVRRILAAAPAHLERHGAQPALLFMEIGNERAAFEAAFAHQVCTWLSTASGDDAVVLIEAHDLPEGRRA